LTDQRHFGRNRRDTEWKDRLKRYLDAEGEDLEMGEFDVDFFFTTKHSIGRQHLPDPQHDHDSFTLTTRAKPKVSSICSSSSNSQHITTFFSFKGRVSSCGMQRK
jgi:hypothetical protein